MSSHYTYVYTLKYEYVDAQGRTQHAKVTRGDKPWQGQELTVYVHPLEPKKVIAPKDNELKPSNLAAEVVGYLLFAAVVLVALNVFLEL